MVTFDEYQGASSPIPDEVVRRANDRYWNSDAGVNQLARDLDLSKGTLYEILAPLPAGLACPCGDGELGFANRTARERGFLSCAACGLEDEKERMLARLEEAPKSPAPPRSPAPLRSSASPLGPGTLLALTALAGVGVGLALAGLLRRR
jgi:hypothetical protein